MGMGAAKNRHKPSLAEQLAGKVPVTGGENTQTQKDDKTKAETADVRKGLLIDKPLNARLRKFCFDQEITESTAFRRALDEYLNKRGY